MTTPEIGATDHVGYVVEDVAAGIEQFTLLGFALLARAELEQFGLEVAMMTNGAEKVELVRVGDPDGDQRRRGRARLRLDHVAYRVADLEATMTHLRDLGADLLGPDDRRIAAPIELAGARHVWTCIGDVRLQFLQ